MMDSKLSTMDYRKYRDNNPFITPKIKCPFCDKVLRISRPERHPMWTCWDCGDVALAYKSSDGWEMGEEI